MPNSAQRRLMRRQQQAKRVWISVKTVSKAIWHIAKIVLKYATLLAIVFASWRFGSLTIAIYVVGIILFLFAARLIVSWVYRRREPNDVSMRSDPDWPRPKRDPRARLFPAPRHDFEAFENSGGKIYLVTHWSRILPFKTWPTRIISTATIVWCVLILPVMPWAYEGNGDLVISQLVTVGILLPVVYTRILIFRFKASYTYGVLTLVTAKLYDGWWEPERITFERSKIIARTSELGKPYERLFGLDIGQLEFKLANIGKDPDLIREHIAGARAINNFLSKLSAQENAAELSAEERARELVKQVLEILPGIATDVTGVMQIAELLLTAQREANRLKIYELSRDQLITDDECAHYALEFIPPKLRSGHQVEPPAQGQSYGANPATLHWPIAPPPHLTSVPDQGRPPYN